jgi:hypothetical protein
MAHSLYTTNDGGVNEVTPEKFLTTPWFIRRHDLFIELLQLTRIGCQYSIKLCLGPSGNAVSAVDVMKAGQSGDRIGGQAGRGYEHEKRERIATHAGERIGGRAGLSELEELGK